MLRSIRSSVGLWQAGLVPPDLSAGSIPADLKSIFLTERFSDASLIDGGSRLRRGYRSLGNAATRNVIRLGIRGLFADVVLGTSIRTRFTRKK